MLKRKTIRVITYEGKNKVKRKNDKTIKE
jgi:hypothetical protein